MVMITVDDLPGIREKYSDKKIVFCSGSFDLTHVGHILFFENCKEYGDILVVAVGKDISIKSAKGDDRPVLNEKVRLKTVDSLKPVDYAFISHVHSETKKLITIEITFEKLKPDTYVINEDAFDIPTRKEIARRFGVELIIIPRSAPPEFEGFSTSKLINKIKKLKN